MSQGCNQVISSSINVAIVPNPNCAAAPVLHRVVLGAAALVGDTSISLSLDALYTPSTGAYTITSSYALVPGTILNFDGVLVEVTNTTSGSGVYQITTTALTVNVKFLKLALDTAKTAVTYFAVKLCLKKSDITTSTTTVDNTTNCTGLLFTQINVGVMKVLDMAGFLTSKDYGYYLLDKIGGDLGSAFFAIDYDRRFFNTGTVQLTDPSITEAVVKQIAGWSVQGQIQSIDSKYGSYLTAAEQTALAAERAKYGFKPAQAIVTIV